MGGLSAPGFRGDLAPVEITKNAGPKAGVHCFALMLRFLCHFVRTIRPLWMNGASVPDVG